MCFAPQRRALFQHLNFQKVVREWCALCILTSKCASRHNGVHFFNISTSKSGPRMVCFVHFDFEMCFAPQRRALFRHHNFQKWCFVRFDLEMCFAPQRRALFRHRNFQKWCFVRFDLVMCFAPQRRAIFHLSSGQPVPLASLLFDPPEPQIIGKTQCFATFLPFRASASSFFLLFLFYSSFF